MFGSNQGALNVLSLEHVSPYVVFYVWQALPGLLVKQRVLLHWLLLWDTVYKLYLVRLHAVLPVAVLPGVSRLCVDPRSACPGSAGLELSLWFAAPR